MLLISGHYEGIDQRVRDKMVDREISIGDYVLTNGALPATVLIDAVSRQVPGVLGDEESLNDESFENNLLAHPQYTRPAEYRGIKVPDVFFPAIIMKFLNGGRKNGTHRIPASGLIESNQELTRILR